MSSCDVPFSLAFEAPGVVLLEGSALMWTGDQCGSLFSIHTDETDRERPPLILGKNIGAKSATNGIHLQTVANTRHTI